jgi:hypothetical protein
MPAGHANTNQTAVQQQTAALRTAGVAVGLLKHDRLAPHLKENLMNGFNCITRAFAVAVSGPFVAVDVVAEQTDVELQHMGVAEHGCIYK